MIHPSTYFSDFHTKRTRRPPTLKTPIQHSREAQTKPSDLKKYKFPPSHIRIHYYKMNSLNSELQPKKEVPQSRNYNLSLTTRELSSNQELETQVSGGENMSVVREELHRQANYLRTLDFTNAKLISELTVLREWQTTWRFERQ